MEAQSRYRRVTDGLVTSLTKIVGDKNVLIGRVKRAFNPNNILNPGKVFYLE